MMQMRNEKKKHWVAKTKKRQKHNCKQKMAMEHLVFKYQNWLFAISLLSTLTEAEMT